MKSGRTLPFTIKEMLESQRMRIAVDNFKTSPTFMKALITELALEIFTVTKNTVIKKYNRNSSLCQRDMLPILREIDTDDLITFNIYFGLSPIEQQLYLAEKSNLSEHDRAELVEKLRKQMMEAS